MGNDFKPVAQPQRHLNPTLKEVVRKEVVKMLEVEMIYPISDSAWVSHVQVVPKKGGMEVIRNKKKKLIPTRTVTGWRMCIDYSRLNQATRKDHFPSPFMDQMLERECMVRNFITFWMDIQVTIKSLSIRKTTRKLLLQALLVSFLIEECILGYLMHRKTFNGVCKRFFSDLIEKCIEVFMDDFCVFGPSFDICLKNLDTMLRRCVETNLVLNW